MEQIESLMKTRKKIINIMTIIFIVAVIVLNYMFINKSEKYIFKETSSFIMYIFINIILLAIISIFYVLNRNEDKNFISIIKSLNEKDTRILENSYKNPIIKSKTLNISKLGLIGINRNGCALINYKDIKKIVLNGAKHSYNIKIYTKDRVYCYQVESLEDLKILKNKIKAKSGCEIKKNFNLSI